MIMDDFFDKHRAEGLGAFFSLYKNNQLSWSFVMSTGTAAIFGVAIGISIAPSTIVSQTVENCLDNVWQICHSFLNCNKIL